MASTLPADLLSPEVEQRLALWERFQQRRPVYVRSHDRVAIVTGDREIRLLTSSKGVVRAPALDSLLARAALQDLDEVYGDSLMGVDAPRHTVLRKVARRGMPGGAIPTMVSDELSEIAEASWRSFRQLGYVDLVQGVARPAASTLASELAGTDRAREEQLTVASRTLSHALSYEAGKAEWESAAAEAPGLLEAARRALEDELPGGVAEAASTAVREGKISRQEGLGLVVATHIAGSETTVSLVAASLGTALCSGESTKEKLRDDPEALSAFVHEVARLFAPVQYFFYETAHSVEVAGVEIPPNFSVLAAFAAGCRDPRRFADPGELSLRGREPSLAFGVGRRYCLGARVAHLLACECLSKVLRAFEGVELQVSSASHGPIGFMHNLTGLRLRAAP